MKFFLSERNETEKNTRTDSTQAPLPSTFINAATSSTSGDYISTDNRSPSKSPDSLLDTIENDEIEPPRKRNKREKHPDHKKRFDGKHHTPCKENRKNATRCKLEGCSQKSHVFCKKCEVHLCLEPDRNCYEKYHYLE